jgi:hypothetical protein
MQHDPDLLLKRHIQNSEHTFVHDKVTCSVKFITIYMYYFFSVMMKITFFNLIFSSVILNSHLCVHAHINM